MTESDDRVIHEALVHSGFTMEEATRLMERHVDRIMAESDHTAYRELADEVHRLIHGISDPDDWDGDDSELHILRTFLRWLPDMVRHQAAEEIRKDDPLATTMSGQLADRIDPFARVSEDRWIRKSDGAPLGPAATGDRS